MVKETMNYNQFRLSPWNRDIKGRTLAKIDKNVKKNGWKKDPITVNEKYEVMDGQHRLTYAKEHHLPVYYIVIPGLTAEDCVRMNNVRTKWELKDYIKLYAQQGDINYIRLSNLVKEFDFTGVSVIAGITHGRCINGMFAAPIREGTFKLEENDYNKARIKLRYMADLAPYIQGIKGRSESMFQAISFCYDHPQVDKERLARKIKERIGTITPPANTDMAFQEIESLYNNKIPQAKYVPIFADYQQYKRDQMAKKKEAN